MLQISSKMLVTNAISVSALLGIIIAAVYAENGRVSNSAEPTKTSAILGKGHPPENPGGKFYRQYWGGFWGRVDDIAFSPDGKYLASAGGPEDKTVRLWDVQSGEELRRYRAEGYSGHYGSVAFSPDGKTVVAGSSMSTKSDPHAAWLWNTDTTNEVHRLPARPPGDQAGVGHTTHFVGTVQAAFSPDGTKVLTTCIEGPALVWDARSGELLQRLGDKVSAAAFSPDGTEIATGNGPGEITTWAASTGGKKSNIKTKGPINELVFSPNGETFLSRSYQSADVIDRATGAIVHHFSNVGWIASAAFSPDGSFVLLGVSTSDQASGGRAELYDLATGKLVRMLEEQHAFDCLTGTVAFSADGVFVATGSGCGPIRLWDAQTGVQLRAFYGHLGSGPDVTFHEDGFVTIASWMGDIADMDATKRQWLDRIRKQQRLTMPEVIKRRHQAP